MTDNQEEIVAFLKERGGRPAQAVEILHALRFGKKQAAALRKELRFLVRSGVLDRGKNRSFSLPSNHHAVGRLSLARDGYGFVALEDGEGPDVFIPARDLNGGYQGDRVAVRILKEERGRRVGAVEQVIERKHLRVTGTLRNGKSGAFVEARYAGIPVQVFLEEYTDLEVGSQVGVAITEFPSDRGPDFVGLVDEVFDGTCRVTNEISKTVFARGIPDAFPEAVLAEAEALPEIVGEEDMRGREDWRHLPFVTIDGEDARDFDDAVCLVRTRRGQRLYVAVADVSHYVRPGTPLDDEARLRGTSAYFPDRVLPMLPEKLSNGLCSLNPHVDRLVEGVWFDFSKEGEIRNSGVAEAVIHSHARLTYTQVARLLENQEGEKPPEAFHEMLRNLSAITDRLFQERLEQGALDLEVPEAWFRVSEDGSNVEEVKTRTRTPATGLIEECMLLANRTVAKRFLDAGLATAFRIHEPPDPMKIAAFFRMAGLSGREDGSTGKDVQEAMEQIRDPDRKSVLQGLLLRALQKARYAPQCLGHFGLAFPAYLHFTSPIRRYPDLIVHRLTRVLFIHGSGKGKQTKEELDELAAVCDESSQHERRALEAERDIGDALKACFLENHLGEEFEGTVTGMTHRGMFMRLGDRPLDGFLPEDALPSAGFEFDPERLWYFNRKTRQRIQLGDRFPVVIARASMEERRVELHLTDSGLTSPVQ